MKPKFAIYSFVLSSLLIAYGSAHAAVITTMTVSGGVQFNGDSARTNLLGPGFNDTGNIYTSTHVFAGWGTGNHWLGGSAPGPRAVEFSLGETYTVGEAHIWNMNSADTFQATSATLIFSQNAIFGDADDVSVFQALALPTGGNSYTGEHFTLTPIPDVTHVRVEVTGTGGFVGLSEIRFSAIPEPSAAILGSLGLLALLRRRR